MQWQALRSMSIEGQQKVGVCRHSFTLAIADEVAKVLSANLEEADPTVFEIIRKVRPAHATHGK